MINLEGVINPLSFGWITNGIMKNLHRQGVEFNFFPISNSLDWSVFDTENNSYKEYVANSFNNSVKRFNLNDKSLKIWHINPQSIPKTSLSGNYLLTFHELDALTDEEVNILNSFSKVFVTSRFSQSVFQDFGVKVPVVYVPMGLDNETFLDLKTERPFKDIIVFSIFGKAEKRKGTAKTVQTWIRKYGNNPRFKLHLYITNPFFKPEQMNQIYGQIFEGRPKPFNVDIFPYLSTNSQLNIAYNSTDIVIDMSGGESISLGSLNCVAMGKHAVVHWNSGLKDWATEENAVLVKPSGKEPVYDGIFFHQGQKFNQGNIYTYSPDDLFSALDIAVARFEKNPNNVAGRQLNDSYSFRSGVDSILKEMNN